MASINFESMDRKPTNGPLQRKDGLRCYFADRSGNPVYLTGSHNWSNFQEVFTGDPYIEFGYDEFLDWVVQHNHNFIRGWHWEQTSWDQFSSERCPIRPMPFARTGPGTAKDGLPKFDCTVFNPEYFERLRTRVSQAAKRGIYMSVMLFQGWSTENRFIDMPVGRPWDGHPFNPNNNINDINGASIGGCRAIHSLVNPSVTHIQEQYVRHVIDTVNDLDNVLFEVGNEHFRDAYEWSEHMIRFIHDYEASKPFQHPVGITSGGGGEDAITNEQLFSSSADWVSPREFFEENALYCSDPPEADGDKIIISDSDHLWGIGGNVPWVWKSLCRGLNVALMDPYEPTHDMATEKWGIWGELSHRDHPIFEPIRVAMGQALWYAEKMDLDKVIPRSELSSSGYCLAAEGEEYLVFSETGGEIEITLSDKNLTYTVEWLDTESGELLVNKPILASGAQKFNPPFDGPYVLYLAKQS